jgi:hypothetical protein
MVQTVFMAVGSENSSEIVTPSPMLAAPLPPDRALRKHHSCSTSAPRRKALASRPKFAKSAQQAPPLRRS